MPKLGYAGDDYSAFVKEMNAKAMHFKTDKTGALSLSNISKIY